MKNQVVLVVVFLLIIIAIGSFFLGSRLGNNKPRLIYVPTAGKTVSPSPSILFPVKGVYSAGTTGKVKEINDNKITIEANNNEMIINIDKSTIVFAQPDKPSDKTNSLGSLSKEKKASLTDIKTGNLVSLQLTIFQKGITANAIHILK